jgi:hypothetical protein
MWIKDPGNNEWWGHSGGIHPAAPGSKVSPRPISFVLRDGMQLTDGGFFPHDSSTMLTRKSVWFNARLKAVLAGWIFVPSLIHGQEMWIH